MNNDWLFFAPRSNETSRENFLATLDSGYPIDDVKSYLNNKELQLLSNKKKLYILGNQEGKKNSWLKMKIGDYVAFYAKKEFVYVGRCIFKKESEGLARQLWGNVPGKSDTWEYTFFLDEIRPIKIPLSKIIKLGEYAEKMIVQGFMPINELGMNNILKTYGSLTSFFDNYSEGIETKDFVLLNEISNKESIDNKDLENIDKIFLKGNSDIILREFEQRLSNETPQLTENKSKRIKRNQTIVKNMKQKFSNKCQVCGFTFKKKDGEYYSEVAHIKPIYTKEAGVDKPSNMIVLCPNHHKMLDFGDLEIISMTQYKSDNKIHDLKQHLFK